MPHFVTTTLVDWVDVFTRKSYRDVVVDCLDFCIREKAMVLYGYVIRSNHIQMVVQSGDGDLSGLLRDLKKFTATKIIEKIKSDPESRREWMLDSFQKSCEHLKKEQKHKVWQGGYHAEIVESNWFIKQKVDYIHHNPVKDKIVTLPEGFI